MNRKSEYRAMHEIFDKYPPSGFLLIVANIDNLLIIHWLGLVIVLKAGLLAATKIRVLIRFIYPFFRGFQRILRTIYVQIRKW